MKLITEDLSYSQTEKERGGKEEEKKKKRGEERREEKKAALSSEACLLKEHQFFVTEVYDINKHANTLYSRI